jgi:aminomethyltransferase
VEGALPGAGRNTVSKVNVCGAAVTVSRTGYTGEPVCFELFVPAESVVAVWERILERGAGERVVPVGLGARDTLRLEAGMPLYGHEFGTDKEGNEIPVFAVPLAKFAVSFAERKGDFLGRNALERQADEIKRLERDAALPEGDRLVPRRVRHVCLLDRGVVREGSDVEHDGTSVGYVTSATTVPYWRFEGKGEEAVITDDRGNRCIGLALVDAGLGPRDEVDIVYRERRLKARIVKNHMSVKYPPYARALLPRELRGA